jgi:hypothetical protein
LSSTVKVVELIVVVVPSTCRLPAITRVPVSSPCVAGSIVNVDGPLRYPVVVMFPLEIVPTVTLGVPVNPAAVPVIFESVYAKVFAVPQFVAA